MALLTVGFKSLIKVGFKALLEVGFKVPFVCCFSGVFLSYRSSGFVSGILPYLFARTSLLVFFFDFLACFSLGVFFRIGVLVFPP